MEEFRLERLARFPGVKRPLVLVVMDGVGNFLGDPEGYQYNALYKADTPNLDRLASFEKIVTRLAAHGTAVGLPTDEDQGNSEVGHNALGAGYVVSQGAKLVNDAIEGPLFESSTWRELISYIKERSGSLHLIGLVSDGNVHSHIKHLFALIDGAQRDGVTRLFVHGLLDGRDVDKRSAQRYFGELEEFLEKKRNEGLHYCIASGGGRMVVTMDRYEADWSIVERGWRAHVEGTSDAPYFPDALTAILSLRKETDLDDQYLPAFVIHAPDDPQKPIGRILDGDGVVFFNFRGDRALEISRAFDEKKFHKFEKRENPEVFYAGMLEYDGDAKIPRRYLIAPPVLEKTLGDYLAANGIRQFAMSETQKFGHITYFWNGNNSGVYVRRHGIVQRVQEILEQDDVLEVQEEIPSDIVKTFADAPEMKAPQIAARAAEVIRAGGFDFIRLNFANGDMVGHTGDLGATIVGIETVDRGLGLIIDAVDEVGGTLIVTADHGNAEQMVGWDSKKGDIKRTDEGPVVQVSHTLNSVPFIIHGPDTARFRLNLFSPSPGLGNVAATVLNLLGFEKPAQLLAPIITVE